MKCICLRARVCVCVCVYLGCATLGNARAQLVTTELIENNSHPQGLSNLWRAHTQSDTAVKKHKHDAKKVDPRE